MTSKFNIESYFDDLVEQKLGSYVYVLLDPRDGKPFYVGKAGGFENRGNRRVLAHFEEARAASSTSAGRKIELIREIWNSGKEVEWEIIAHNLGSQEAALKIECAVIDAMTTAGIDLTNIQGGHNTGRMSRIELRAWSAKPFSPLDIPDSLVTHPIFLFNIAKGVSIRKGRSDFVDYEHVLYESVRQSWIVSKRWREMSPAYAVGLINGIGRTAFRIRNWHIDEATGSQRYVFDGEKLNDGEQEALLRNYGLLGGVLTTCRGFWQRGNHLIISVSKGREIEILRGKGS